MDINSAPSATNQRDNPSNAHAATLPDDSAADREAVNRAVEADAEKQTGRPTGAIYGGGGDIMAAQNFDNSANAAGADTEDSQK